MQHQEQRNLQILRQIAFARRTTRDVGSEYQLTAERISRIVLSLRRQIVEQAREIGDADVCHFYRLTREELIRLKIDEATRRMRTRKGGERSE